MPSTVASIAGLLYIRVYNVYNIRHCFIFALENKRFPPRRTRLNEQSRRRGSSPRDNLNREIFIYDTLKTCSAATESHGLFVVYSRSRGRVKSPSIHHEPPRRAATAIIVSMNKLKHAPRIIVQDKCRRRIRRLTREARGTDGKTAR